MSANFDEMVRTMDRVVALVRNPAPGGGVGLQSHFAQLAESARLRSGTTPDDASLREFHRFIRFAHQHLQNLFTLIHRVQWLQNSVSHGLVSEEMFQRLSSADLDMFHVAVRCVLDHVAQSTSTFAKGPIANSFSGMRDELRHPAKSAAISVNPDLVKLVANCTWFDDLRGCQDDLLNRGEDTSVFLDFGRILFRTPGHDRIRVCFHPVMFSAGVIEFKFYIGMWLARLLDFLERWSEIILKISGTPADADSIFSNLGVGIARDWIAKVRVNFAISSAFQKGPSAEASRREASQDT